MIFMSDPRPDEAGRPGAVTGEELLPLVYDELRRLAAARLVPGQAGLTLQPTALVHEAWIRLSRHLDRGWQDREHFFNAAALTPFKPEVLIAYELGMKSDPSPQLRFNAAVFHYDYRNQQILERCCVA